MADTENKSDICPKKSTSHDFDLVEPIRVNVQEPLKSFFGRQKLLQQLHAVLQKDRLAIVSSASGSSSKNDQHSNNNFIPLGKTETARAYVDQYKNLFYKNVIWLPSQNEESLQSAFVNFAKKYFEIDSKNPTADGSANCFESIVDQVYQIIMSGKLGSTLIIFDDVSDYKIIKHFVSPSPLLKCEDHCPFVLILKKHCPSQNDDDNDNNYWPQNSFTVLQLDVFDEEEAVSFVLKFLDLPATEMNKKDAIDLCKYFGQIPLALQFAVAFINQKNYREAKTPFKISKNFTLKDYIKMFKISKKPTDCFCTSDWEKIVRTALNLNLQKILAHSTGYYGAKYPKIVDTLALLHGDCMDVHMLHALMDPQLDQSVLDKCLKILENYAIIHVRNQDDNNNNGEKNYYYSLTMHPMVQKIILEKLVKSGDQKMDEMLEDVVCKFEKIFENFSQFPAPLQQNFFQNMIQLAHHMGAACGKSVVGPSKNQILFKVTLASKLKHCANYLPALRLYREIYEFIKTQRGENHLLTIGAKIQIANLLHTKGDLGEALEMYLQIYDVQQQGNGNVKNNCKLQQQILDSMKNIGNILHDLGRWDEAVEIYEQILLQQQQKNLDKANHHQCNSLDGVAFLSKLASLKEKQGKVEEALKFYEEAGDISNNILGAGHPTTRMISENLSKLKLNVVQSTELMSINN